MDKTTNQTFFCPDEVVVGCSNLVNPISETFKTLLLERGLKQQDLADGISYDKANISRIVNGLYIPDLDMRLKISKFLCVDSSVIWRNKDIEYIREVMRKQLKNAKKEGIL